MDRYRVKPGSSVKLKAFDPDDTSAVVDDKDQAKAELLGLSHQLDVLQERLYAEHQHKLLVVLQGMDTSGKDSTIRHVFQNVDPLGVRVACFKAPSSDEMDHDYLWRVHRHVPAKGEIVIFNRSHYEDVGIARVHKLIGREVWNRRYEHINAFERMLTEEGTTILKFFLNISKSEQKERLEARLNDPDKRWKFAPSDVSERKLWPKYINAYEDAIGATSTNWAPWYVVPANKKWYRNLVVASIIVEALRAMDLKFPRAPDIPADTEIS